MNNDLISRSFLLDRIGKHRYYSVDPFDQRGKIRDIIALVPYVDAVEVVRCKDCVNREISPINPRRMYCHGLDVSLPTDLEFYCARGVKMDAEVEGC